MITGAARLQRLSQHITWTRGFYRAMQPFSTGGSYPIFPGFSEEREALVRQASGPNYARLVEVKRRSEPAHLFRLNQNIEPA